MQSKINHIICIGGPTGIGKTELAVKLAERLNTDIISVDSRQIYREMNIGTAKPSEAQLSKVKHHFINSASLYDNYSAGDFERDADRILMASFKTKKVIIACGGTGLYFQALCHGLNEFPEIDKEIRNSLIDELESKGLKALVSELQTKDPAYAKKADLKNPRRVVRALEVIRQSSQTYSSFLHPKKEKTFKSVQLFVNMDRDKLYNRINKRVDQMVANGLEQEAQELRPILEKQKLKTVGYHEWSDYFDGVVEKENAVEKIKQNSRNYAKRQITWFKNKEWKEFQIEQTEVIFDFIKSQMS